MTKNQKKLSLAEYFYNELMEFRKNTEVPITKILFRLWTNFKETEDYKNGRLPQLDRKK